MHQLLTKKMGNLDIHSLREILERRFHNDSHTKLSLIPSPFLFKDIKKAALRVKEAIDEKQKIVIVGDYDVDGIVSSVILSEFFEDFNIPHEVIIPNRFTDGYGLNAKILSRVEADLVITVDNGISAVEAALICKDRGIDLIITDHHTPPLVLPDAYAIVNPKQEDCEFPNSEICGAQVAWYFVAALKDVCELQYNLSKSLDLLAIAIMADMMELVDINRTMVKSGLKVLKNSQRPAFVAIREYFNKDSFVSDDISFLISPLLNSAGRMEDAIFSYYFLKSRSLDEARIRLEEIDSLNSRRKSEEKYLYDLSLQHIDDSDSIIVVWGEEWHEGVVGIVASRLTKRYKKPAIVFSVNGDKAKGSARSVAGVDILSLVSAQKDLLLGFGGHFGAAGTLLLKENLVKFKEQIILSMDSYEIVNKETNSDLIGELKAQSIGFELLEVLEEFEPYGQKNPKPSFVLKNMYVKIEKTIGKDNNHKKLILLSDDGVTVEALFFNFNEDIKREDTIDIVFNISKNSFRGVVTPQVLIKEVLDIRR